MIKTFRDRRTAAVWAGVQPKGVGPALAKQARKTLVRLDAARTLHDLRGTGLKLEALREDRAGQHGIRVSGQFRICFVWRDGDAYDAELVDYH